MHLPKIQQHIFVYGIQFVLSTSDMFIKIKYLKVHIQFNLALGSKLNYSILVFLALFYFFGETNILAGTSSRSNRVEQSAPNINIKALSNTYHYAVHLPFETAHKDWLNEDKEEDENKLYWTCSFKPAFSKSFRSDSFLSVLNLNLKQAKVPLFILYHAWRTFLS
jgi:hypothetical protein